jgi:hypothetical protein
MAARIANRFLGDQQKVAGDEPRKWEWFAFGMQRDPFPKDSPVNGSSAPVFRLMSDS